MFFKSLCNLFKCAFCTRTDCSVRYQIGGKYHDSELGLIPIICPKTVPRMEKLDIQIHRNFEKNDKKK